MSEQRRKFSAQQKAKIVREGLSGTRPISELCRHYGESASGISDIVDMNFASEQGSSDVGHHYLAVLLLERVCL